MSNNGITAYLFSKKNKKYCYADLSENDVADQKHFCKTV